MFFVALCGGLLFLFADPGAKPPFRAALLGSIYIGFVRILGEPLARGLIVLIWVAFLWLLAFGGRKCHAQTKSK
jgi:hypothetical protein